MSRDRKPAPADLTERRSGGGTVYHGKLLRVEEDRVVLPDGKPATREYIVHPGAVVVIAVLEDGALVLERQHRYPLRRDLIELPAGKLHAGEDPLECARRELREETGYAAAQWRELATVHPCVGYSSERLIYFLARGLRHVGAAPDDGEHLEVFTLSLAEALAWVREGRITDGKTVAGLFWAEKVLSGQWPLEPEQTKKSSYRRGRKGRAGAARSSKRVPQRASRPPR